MAFLPDEIWRKILEMGVSSNRLTCRDLCSLAITCRRHNRLSSNRFLWSMLVALDFPQGPRRTSSLSPALPPKVLYKTMFERRIAARRRAILISEREVALCVRRLEELERVCRKEAERMKAALEELKNLERVRQAPVAPNVWKPVIVRGSQRQTVEQCTVPIQSRISDLKMEVSVCRQQIATFKNAYVEEKRKLVERERSLAYADHITEFEFVHTHLKTGPTRVYAHRRSPWMDDPIL